MSYLIRTEYVFIVWKLENIKKVGRRGKQGTIRFPQGPDYEHLSVFPSSFLLYRISFFT